MKDKFALFMEAVESRSILNLCNSMRDRIYDNNISLSYYQQQTDRKIDNMVKRKLRGVKQ